MKFLILSHFAGAPQYGMVYRNYTWAKELTQQGHDVTVVACHYSHTRNKQPEITGRITKENIDGANYIWIKGFTYSPNSAIMRILAMLWFTFQTYFFPVPVDDDYDTVVMSSPQPFTIITARKWAKKFKAKLVYDIRDLWPATLVEIGGQSKKHPIIWLMQKMEDYSCRVADLVTAIQKDCEDYLKSRGLRDNRFLHISNGITDDDLNNDTHAPLPKEHIEFINDLRSQGKKILGYAGAIGHANCIHAMIEALAKTDDNIHAVCVGHGNLVEDLKRLSSSLNIGHRVHFLPPVRRDQVPDFLNRIDVANIIFRKADLYKLGVSPTKLNDYMAAAKPILYAVDEQNDPIEQSGGGVSCDAEDIDAIAKGFSYLFSLSDTELKKLGEKNRQWLIDNQRVSDQMTKLVEKIKTL